MLAPCSFPEARLSPRCRGCSARHTRASTTLITTAMGLTQSEAKSMSKCQSNSIAKHMKRTSYAMNTNREKQFGSMHSSEQAECNQQKCHETYRSSYTSSSYARSNVCMRTLAHKNYTTGSHVKNAQGGTFGLHRVKTVRHN